MTLHRSDPVPRRNCHRIVEPLEPDRLVRERRLHFLVRPAPSLPARILARATQAILTSLMTRMLLGGCSVR